MSFDTFFLTALDFNRSFAVRRLDRCRKATSKTGPPVIYI